MAGKNTKQTSSSVASKASSILCDNYSINAKANFVNPLFRIWCK